MNIVALLGEVIAFLPTAINLGLDVADVVNRAVALSQKPTPVTPDEMLELKNLIDSQKAIMDGLTNRLEADPPSDGA